MPTRFRRTINILPGVKANISKGGVSFTVGTKGYHLNFSKRGVRQTVGLPGTGISNTSYLVKNDPKPETKKDKDDESDAMPEQTTSSTEEKAHPSQPARRRRTPVWVLLVGILVIYLGALVLGLVPMNFLSQVLRTVTEWIRSVGL